MIHAAGYLSLLISSFLASTLIPMSSEAVLAGLFAAGLNPYALFAVATIGNTAGAALNWILGRMCMRWLGRPWFPFSRDQIERGSSLFNRYGKATLLFSWLPVVGDPLTVAAGLLGIRFWVFLALVLIGKAARYVAVIAAVFPFT